MQEAKHVPGPWYSKESVVIQESTGHTIARCDIGGRDEETQANAELMAQAWEIPSFLEQIHDLKIKLKEQQEHGQTIWQDREQTVFGLRAELLAANRIADELRKALTIIGSTQYRTGKGGLIDPIEIDHCIRIARKALIETKTPIEQPTLKVYTVEELFDIDKTDQHDVEVLLVSELTADQRGFLGLPKEGPSVNATNWVSWKETHYEVCAAIERVLRVNIPSSKSIVIKRQETQGHTGLYELAEELTNEFEAKYKGTEWGMELEFYDEIEKFLEEKLKP